MANFPFTVGDSLRIGSATISATGNAVVLPAGTQVGNQSVATSTDVSTGGGPKITNLQVTSNVYVVLDDTAVELAGGFIKLTGTNFVSGCMVYVASTPANSTTFVSTTEVRAALPATAAGTYPVYVVNPDGGTAIRVPGVTFSASPAWQTASSLGEQYDGVVLSLPVVATDATVYTLSSGSLPPGLSLNSNTGVISGTVTGVANDTVYSFTITATDAQLQDSPRTFTVTITVSDPYFRLTTLLLGGEQGNTVVRDSSVNNFNLTVFGDSRATNFTPYGTGWSVYFDGTGDYLNIANNAAFDFSTGDFTFETWFYLTANGSANIDGTREVILLTAFPTGGTLSNDYGFGIAGNTTTTGTGLYFGRRSGGVNTSLVYNGTIDKNVWYHFAVTRSGSNVTFYLNGSQVYQSTSFSGTVNSGGFPIKIAALRFDGNYELYFPGYISNLRVVKGTALYTANFTPATTNLTSVANTSLLTCHANRFLDASTNNFTVTRNGDAAVRSFNPFTITNTGVNGSMYFDGTGDYLSLTNSSALAFGTNDFTVEFWSYLTVAKSAGSGMGFIHGTSGSGNFGMSTDFINIYAFTVGGSGLSFAYVPKVDRWTHYAFVRSSGSAKLYVDGVQVGTSQSYTTNITGLTGSTYVGAETGPTNYYTGYLTGLRYVNGTAVYTANFTPATTSLTAVTNTQLLTLQYRQPHNNHSFQDSSSNQFLITRNGNATQGTFSPFSQTGWSTYLYDGLIQASMSTNGQFGTGDFTVDLWVYPQSGSQSTGNVIWSFAQYPNGIFITYNNDGTISVFSNGATRITGGAGTLTFNSWSHIAVSRSSTALRLFLNGSQIGITYTDSSNYTQGFYGIGRPDDVASYYYRGYLSNFRVVKGTALYTANFTPSTTSLTAVANTQLLTLQSNRYRDNSTNNYAVTVSGTYSIQAFSPFAPTAVYSPAVHGGSAYFDGTTDYLTLADSPNLNLSTGDFTVEVWFYPTSNSGGRPIIGRNNGNFSTPAHLQHGIYQSGTSLIVRPYSSTTDYTINTGSFVLNAWNHAALVRTGNTFYGFLNGTRAATTQTITGSLNNGTWLTYIGGSISSIIGSEFFLGYINDVRILKGTALYTGATYTVPTAPLTAIANTQLLLNFTDAAILDRTGRMVVETVADAQTSSVQVKYGNGAMSFDGTGDTLSLPASQNYVFGGDLTVEGWVYIDSTMASSRPDNLKTFIFVGWNTGNTPQFYVYGTTSTAGIGLGYYDGTTAWEVAATVPKDQWVYLAYVRTGSALYGFVNGTRYTINASISATIGSTNALVVGGNSSQGSAYYSYLKGYIDDLRITQGYARYTANFTPPTVSHRLK
jgi:hypothetical protein